VLFNIGCGTDVTIKELAELVCRVVGFTGSLTWNTSKPDGTPRKLLDVSRMKTFDWKPRVTLEEGIRLAYADFAKRFGTAAPEPTTVSRR